MYRGSLYQKSDETLKNFSRIFNMDKNYPHLRFIPNQTETYDNDGIIYNELTGTFIGFDWEYRERYFSNCNFQFDTLGQYERKLIKPSIQLAIQCDATETGIAVGWHEDWLKENQKNLTLLTDNPQKQYGTVRYTKNFKIYSYENLEKFKKMLNEAFSKQKFNSESF